MKLKLTDCQNFNTFYSLIKENNIPFRTAFKFSKIGSIIKEDIEFYTSSMKKLIEEYAERDEDNNIKYSEDNKLIRLKEETLEECKQKMAELDELEYNADIEQYLLTFDDLELLDLPAEQWMLIMKFIQE